MSYSRGLMKTLLASVETMTRFGDGSIDVAREALTNSIERLVTDVENLEYRLQIREAQLVRSFTEAERAISLLQSQQAAFGAAV
jgi:flagellar capping protein FliD